jgi:anti-anti-sigma regulatory factor
MESAYSARQTWAPAEPRTVQVPEEAEESDGRSAGPGIELFADKQLVVLRTTVPPGVRFAGEIDASNSYAVSDSLAAAVGLDGDIHVDVSNLLFCDISGIRELVSAAESMDRGRRLLLHGMPALLETVIRVVGWNQLPTLVVCECGSD